MTYNNKQRLLLTSMSIAIIAVVFSPALANAELPFSNDKEEEDWLTNLLAEKSALKAQAKKANEIVLTSPGSDIIMADAPQVYTRIQEINEEIIRVAQEQRDMMDITPEEQTKLDAALLKIVEIKWLPLVYIAVDQTDKVLDIKLHQLHKYSDPVLRQYLKTVIDIPFVLSYGPYATFDLCATNTSDCDPIIGGIEFHTEKGNCTIGLPVKMNHPDGVKTGFITAGHCVNEGDSFQQPSNGTTNDGFVIKKLARSFCDCAFVETNSTDFRQKVFTPDGEYTITNRADPQIKDKVRMEGKTSGERSGKVVNTDAWLLVIGEYYFDHVIEIDTFASQKGDSGAPIIDASDTKTFHGTVSAHGWGHTFAIKWSNIQNQLDIQ